MAHIVYNYYNSKQMADSNRIHTGKMFADYPTLEEPNESEEVQPVVDVEEEEKLHKL